MFWFLLASAGLLAVIGLCLTAFADEDRDKLAGIVVLILSFLCAFGAGHVGAAGRPASCEKGLYQQVAVVRANGEGNTAYILVRDKDKQLRLFAIPSANLHADDTSARVRLTSDENGNCHTYAE